MRPPHLAPLHRQAEFAAVLELYHGCQCERDVTCGRARRLTLVPASIAVTLLLEATCEGAKPARACICDSIMLQLRKRAMPNHDLTPDIVCAGARQGPAGGVGGSPTAATRQALAGYHQVARAGVNSSGAQGAGDWGAGRVYGKANTKHMTKVAINYTGPPKSQFVAAQR